MRNIRRAIRIILILALGLFLHYVLPKQNVARVTSTEVIRTDFSNVNRLFFAQPDAGASEQATRDLRLINTERRRTYLLGLVRGGLQTRVFRNEDTGWIYPPYFKFDSADLQAEAAAAVSTAEPYEWKIVTSYGWRIQLLTIYPNAVSIRDASGPDHRPIPFVNIFVIAALVAGWLFVRVMWLQFRERTLDPIADAAGDRVDHVQAEVAARRGRFRRWLDTWRSKDG